MTWPWPVRLDRKTCSIGVFDGVSGGTTWTIPFHDETINTIVLSDDFGTTAGTVLTPETIDGMSFSIAGDYSGGCVMLGRLYSFSIELSKVFRRGFQGIADIDAWTTVTKIIAAFRASGPFQLRAALAGFPDRIERFNNPEAPLISGAGIQELVAFFTGPGREMRLFIESTSAAPLVIPSIDIELDEESRRGDQ